MMGPGSGAAPGGPGGAGTGGTVTSTEATPEATPTPTATPTAVPLAHAGKWGITFDYPTDWALVDKTKGQPQMMPATEDPIELGYAGTGSATQTCTAWTQQSAPKCTTTWSLPDDSIVLRFSSAPWVAMGVGSVQYTWTGYQAIYGPEIPGADKLTIDNLPVRFAMNTSDAVPYSTETVPGATEVLWWGLPGPQPAQTAYSIVAAIRGTDTAQLEAEARAVVESLHFVPEPTVLPADPAALAEARQNALDNFFLQSNKYADDEHNHAYDCFPRTPGASNNANIIQTLNTSPMTKPLAVTCTTASIEPDAMQGWTIILKQTWAAGSDYSAGEVDLNEYVMGDGSPLGGSFNVDKNNPTQGMYPHVGPSKYKG